MRLVVILTLVGAMVVSGCGKTEDGAVASGETGNMSRETDALFEAARNCILTNYGNAASLGDAYQSELMKITDLAAQRRRAMEFEDYVFGVRIDHLPYGRRTSALVAMETLSDRTWIPGHMSYEWNRRLRMIEFMRQQKKIAESQVVMAPGRAGDSASGNEFAMMGFVEHIESYIRTHLEFYELDFVERASSEMGKEDFRRLAQRFERVLGRKLRTVDQINEDRSRGRKEKNQRLVESCR